MKLVRFPLKPMSHFHFGEIAQDDKSHLATTSSFPHSDTLFSSLVNSYAQINDKEMVDSFVEDFVQRGTVVSSMFYYLKTQESLIYFLPKPLTFNTQTINRSYYKRLKQIEFISTAVWETITSTDDFFDDKKCFIIQGRFVVLRSEIDNNLIENIRIYSKTTQPKEPIRNLDKNASIYFETDVEIADNSGFGIEIGFYFLYTTTRENRLKDAIEQMSSGGIGGGRSTGTGALGIPVFDDNASFDTEIMGNNKFYCISMAIPANDEEFKKFELYETKINGGREMKPGKQLFVRMIKEGAVLTGETLGKFAEIGIDENGNQILRNGSCFLLPLKTI